MAPQWYTPPQVQDRIEGAAALTAFYGYFPNFHDAEVVSLTLDRTGPTLDITVHTSRPTNAVDGLGYYVNDRHALVDIHFTRLGDIGLTGFTQSTVVNRMVFVDAPGGRITCHLDDCRGLHADVTAAGVAISFRPATADGTPIPPPDR